MSRSVFPSPVLRFLLPLILALLLVTTPGTMAQAVGARGDAVGVAANEVFRLLDVGDGSAVYDLVHPDVRNRLPRRAFVDWLAGSVPLDDPVVETVTFTNWTSAVTGSTYAGAALVSLTHRVARDGVAAEEATTWIFVDDGERWRWFPGITAAELATLAAADEEAPGSYLPSFRQAAYVRIDRFWQAEFFAAGRQYVPLEIRPVTADAIDTGCGTIPDMRQIAIFYCVFDATVYFDPRFRDQVTDQAGGFGWTMVISHEWAHHIQALLGIDLAAPGGGAGLPALGLELQADCLAAVATQDAFARGDIERDEVDAATVILSLAGDPPGTDPNGPGAHGTADQRLAAFAAGFDSGYRGCDVDLESTAA